MATDIDAVKAPTVPQPTHSLPEVILNSLSGPLLLEMMRLAPSLWQIFADALTENAEGRRALLLHGYQCASSPLPAVEAPKKHRARTLRPRQSAQKRASHRGKNQPQPKLRKRRTPRLKQHRGRLGAVSSPASSFWEMTGEQVGDFSDSPESAADALRSRIAEEWANWPRRFNAS